jgi:peptidoglycan DL-endopeptidase CwlS
MVKSKKIIAAIALSAVLSTLGQTSFAAVHTVTSGENLWIISQKYGVSIEELKKMNSLSKDTIYIGQKLNINESYNFTYTVKSGDMLWKIAERFGTTAIKIKQLNNLKDAENLYVGQKLNIKTDYNILAYTVKQGDMLWKVANTYGTTINKIKEMNGLTSDYINVGQVLYMLNESSTQVLVPSTPKEPVEIPSRGGQQPVESPKPVYNWPEVTYIVQPGDTAYLIGKKFGVSASDIMKYNYMGPNDWFNAGEKIAISGYAPRTYIVTPGEDSMAKKVGKLVDWVTEGQYLFKIGDKFVVTDVRTGTQFSVTMIGGANHVDIEPSTAQDTVIMKNLFNNNWTWTPRPVVIFKDGMNIAASLSGMPHSFDTVKYNDVSGMFDLYLLNSSSHASNVSESYKKQHADAVLEAAGR